MALNLTNQHDDCCLRCQGRRVVIGKLTGMSQEGFFRCFRPGGFWSTLAHDMGLTRRILVPVSSESFLCLDCGTVWTTIDPKSAEATIRREANDRLKECLGLAEKTKTPVDELA